MFVKYVTLDHLLNLNDMVQQANAADDTMAQPYYATVPDDILEMIPAETRVQIIDVALSREGILNCCLLVGASHVWVEMPDSFYMDLPGMVASAKRMWMVVYTTNDGANTWEQFQAAEDIHDFLGNLDDQGVSADRIMVFGPSEGLIGSDFLSGKRAT